MIDDFGQAEDGARFGADVCIVGAGAVGIALALEFLGGPHRVLLVEAGGPHHEDEAQRLMRVDLVGKDHTTVNVRRARVLGGTTTWWAGQASPFDPIDFRARDWVPHSGWPIGRADLEPYFPRAERVMHLPAATYDAQTWAQPGAPPEFDPSVLRAVYSQFSPKPDFRLAYRDRLRESEHVRVLLHASVTEVVANPEATAVDRLEIRGRDGRRGTVRARHYVLCAGAVETPRLLLASAGVEPAGLGNRHDLVGRFFQEHLHGRVARVVPADRKRFQRSLDACYLGPIKRCPKVAAAEPLQERERILNIAFDLVYEAPVDSAVEAAKVLYRAPRRPELRGRVPWAVRALLRRPHEPALAGFRHFVLRRPVASNRGPIYLGLQGEQQPNPESRVRLADDRDALGMPRAALDWRLSPLDVRTVEVFLGHVDAEFARLGLGRVDPGDLDAFRATGRGDGWIFDANHQMGTTRMADDPRRGVVDRHCRVHGVGNLHIGGAAVFPTGGYSNPTFNAIALGLRTADRLKRLLDETPAASGAATAAAAGPAHASET